MSENDMQDDMQKQVAIYRQLVLEYEALDEQIDQLIMQHEGHTENMSPEDLAHYRELAHKRAEIRNEMRYLEQQLFNNDDS